MKSSDSGQDAHKAQAVIEDLRSALEEADPIIEKCLQYHSEKKPEYEEQKHLAFQHLNDVLIKTKAYLRHSGTTLNTRPLSRLLEEFRNSYAGADNVLIGHKNPNLSHGGKPAVAASNEHLALLVAAINTLKQDGQPLVDCLKRVSDVTDFSTIQLRNIRTRFGRKDSVSEEVKDLARRLSVPPDPEQKEYWFQNLINQFQQIQK